MNVSCCLELAKPNVVSRLFFLDTGPALPAGRQAQLPALQAGAPLQVSSLFSSLAALAVPGCGPDSRAGHVCLDHNIHTYIYVYSVYVSICRKVGEQMWTRT